MGCRIAGDTGTKVVLGEVDVARVNPCRSGQGEPPVHLAWFAAVTPFRVRLELCPLPGGRRPPGPDDADDVWRGQKEGSV